MARTQAHAFPQADTPRPIVIKYGGNAMTDPALQREVAAAIARVPMAVVVHGGGPFIAEALFSAGIASTFVRGLRVTTLESLPIIESTLTLLGKKLAHAMPRAIGLTGRDSALLCARIENPELGFVGEITSVNTDVLSKLLAAELTPVVACIAQDEAGGVLNINADDAASAIAAALCAPIVFLSNIPGVLDDPNDPQSLLTNLSQKDILARIEDGRISGGMIPKVQGALRALAAGAPSAIIADGRKPQDLSLSLAGKKGTTICR